MDKHKSIAVQYALILVLGAAIAGLVSYILFRSRLNADVTFAPDHTVIDNPLMGFAPDAQNIAYCEKSRLVYVSLTWAEWEPREGVFAVDALERANHLARWRADGKHAVLRFICDIPRGEDHLDIPRWLYEKTGNGTHYDTALGKGYSPDYADETFRAYHEKALAALAEYCNRDDFVAFVQLGSLGHWGEWHASDAGGRSLMPDERVCADYAALYAGHFTNAKLLTRRNYDFAVDGGVGFFNDMVGDEADTEEWLGWLQNGGSQRTSGEALTLKPAGSWGRTAPVGGEFTSSTPMDVMLGSDIGQVLSSVSLSNMTFIGPMVPDPNAEEYALAAQSVLRRMGYRIYVSRLRTQYDFANQAIRLTLSFRNAGNAGFFFDWPVTLSIWDRNKKAVYTEILPLDLRSLNTGDEISAEACVPVSDAIEDAFYVGVSITSPDGTDHVRLAIDAGKKAEFAGDVQLIYHYDKTAAA